MAPADEAAGSIKVVVRVRPLNRRERALGAKCVVDMDGNQTTVRERADGGAGAGPAGPAGSVDRDRGRSFTFDRSYWSCDDSRPFATQDTVFEDLGRPLLANAFAGFNNCIFAYGQTGSGKSYSMMGTADEPGLIPRICEALFARLAAEPERPAAVEVAYLEIYNERVRDLLAPKRGSLRIREHPTLGPYVEDLSRLAVGSYADVAAVLEAGNRVRTVAATGMNENSSRSHAVFTLTLAQRAVGADGDRVSRISLVDLAGSERAAATQASGALLKEGSEINKSLSTLGRVINVLAARRGGVVPYRDSALTWLLKDSLGGNSQTAMLAAISPADVNFGETLSTLRYADSAKRIRTHAVVNEDPRAVLVRELQAELAALRARVAGSPGAAPTDSPATAGLVARLNEAERQLAENDAAWQARLAAARHRDQVLDDLGITLDRGFVAVRASRTVPCLVNLSDDPLVADCLVYNVPPGVTRVGNAAAADADIRLAGAGILAAHCELRNEAGAVTIVPAPGAAVLVNGLRAAGPRALHSGYRIMLGDGHVFRFNHPQEAQRQREAADRPDRPLSPASDETASQDSGRRPPLSLSSGDWPSRHDLASFLGSDSSLSLDHLPDDDLDRLYSEMRRVRSLRTGRPESQMDLYDDESPRGRERKIAGLDDALSRALWPDWDRGASPGSPGADVFRTREGSGVGGMGGGNMVGGNMVGGNMTAGYTPGGNTPGGYMPGGNMTAGYTPGGNTPGGYMPGGNMATGAALGMPRTSLSSSPAPLATPIGNASPASTASLVSPGDDRPDRSDRPGSPWSPRLDSPWIRPDSPRPPSLLATPKRNALGERERAVARLAADRWTRAGRVRMSEAIYRHTATLRQAQALAHDLGCRLRFQFTVVDDDDATLPSAYDLILNDDEPDDDTALLAAAKPCVAVRVVDLSTPSVQTWSLARLEGQLQRVRALRDARAAGADTDDPADAFLPPFRPMYSAVGDAAVPLSCLSAAGPHVYAADVISPHTLSIVGIAHVELEATPGDRGSGVLVRLRSVDGFSEREFTEVHAQLVVAGAAPGHLADGVPSTQAVCGFADGPLEFDAVLALGAAALPADPRAAALKIRFYARVRTMHLEKLQSWDSMREDGPRVLSSTAAGTAAAADRPAARAHDVFVRVQVLELSESGAYEPAGLLKHAGEDRRTFLLHQGVQRRVQVSLTHSSGDSFDWSDAGRLAVTVAGAPVARVELRLVARPRTIAHADGTRTVVVAGQWDSSAHSSAELDRPTAPKASVTLAVSWAVSAPCLIAPADFSADVVAVIQTRQTGAPGRLALLLASARLLYEHSALFAMLVLPYDAAAPAEYARGLLADDDVAVWTPRSVRLVRDYTDAAARRRRALDVLRTRDILRAHPPTPSTTPAPALLARCLRLWATHPPAPPTNALNKFVGLVRAIPRAPVARAGAVFVPDMAMRAWDRRWLELRRPFLYIHSAADADDLLAINVAACRVDTEPELSEALQRAHVFAVVTDQTNHLFGAKSATDVGDWVLAIASHVRDPDL
ncbi:uncharacterized protein V1510DRAFT_433745 [Dipodascopsis tothii]|uniref:uncharacterized protein n=1 Tax=Dipodascopsis tothii TaxID=44089 RepID=UPI0034CD2436